MKVPWDIFWESEAVDGQGRPARRQARRALACRCSATRCTRARSPTSTPRIPAIIAKAGAATSRSSPTSATSRSTITDYQTLPEGKTWLHHSWSGDLLAAALYYLPQGHEAGGALVLGPRRGTASCRTTTSGSRRRPRSPLLAHAFLNFMLDEKNAYDNFVQFNGYMPPQNTIDGDSLVKEGLIPKTLAAAVILRPDQFANNQELLALSVEGEHALAAGLVEVQGRLVESRGTLDLARARLPGVVWLSVFFLVALYAVLCVALGNQNTLNEPSRSGTRSTGTSATCSRRCATSGAAGRSSRSSCARSPTSRSRWRSRS